MNNFNNIQNTESALVIHSKMVEKSMLQCRRNEKDFLLKKDKKYLGKLNNNISIIEKEAEDLNEMVGKFNI